MTRQRVSRTLLPQDWPLIEVDCTFALRIDDGRRSRPRNSNPAESQVSTAAGPAAIVSRVVLRVDELRRDSRVRTEW